MLTDLPFLCPETPLKEQGQMQPPLPLVGEAIEQKGTRGGTWHIQPIVLAMAALGISAPVVLGCYRLRHVECGRRACGPGGCLANSDLVGAGGRKGPRAFLIQPFIYFE